MDSKMLRRGTAGASVLACVMCLVGILAGGANGSTVGKKPILVGAAGPFSGAAAYVGQDWLHGLQLSIGQINAAGGINGRKLKIVTADNACDPAESVNATTKLINLNHVSVIFGGACSGATLAAMPLIQKAHVVQITSVSSNPQITQQAGVGGNIWEFRINADDSVIAGTFSKYIAKRAKSVMMIAENDDFGHGAVSAYQTTLPKAGVKFLDPQYFTPGQPDYRSILANVQQSKPDALLLIMESQDASVFIKQFHELGLKTQLYSRGSVVTPEFLKDIAAQPTLGDGIVEASFWSPGEDKKFDRAFMKKYGTLPPANGSGPYYAAKVLAAALKVAHGKTDANSIRKALRKLNMKLAWGQMKFDAHNQAHPNITLSTITNGKIRLLSVIKSS